jgi:Sec-independent protein secretion pathway component TatC
MIALAVPMWLLYELGVILAWFLVLKRRATEESEEEAPEEDPPEEHPSEAP